MIIAVVSIICITLLILQINHIKATQAQLKSAKMDVLSAELEQKIKEFEDYKKRVDALSIKVGFKL